MNFIFSMSLTFLFTINIASAFAQGVKLEIDLEKPQYLENEPVYILACLVNNSTIKYEYNYFDIHTLNFDLKVVDENNNVLKITTYKGGDLLPPTKYYLEPTKREYTFISLLSSYANNIDAATSDLSPFFAGIKVGNYTVQGIYTNKTDTLQSNIIQLKVKSPDSKENDAYNNLQNIFKEEYSKKISINVVNKFKTFIMKFNNSVFIPMAKQYLATSYERLYDNKNATKIAREIVREYPQSMYMINVLRESYFPKEEKIAFCKNKLVKSKNFVERYAKYFLETINEEN